MLRRLWRSFLFALALALLLTPAAVAHAALESAAPGPDDEVVGTPAELIARFSQDLDPSRTVLEVRDAAGTRIVRGGERGDDEREFRLALPALAPGGYEVRWTSFSAEDGELARDAYRFTVVTEPSSTPTPSPSSAPSRPSSTSSATPSATATITPTPGPSPAAVPPATPASALETALPIVATASALAVVAFWLLRRRHP